MKILNIDLFHHKRKLWSMKKYKWTWRMHITALMLIDSKLEGLIRNLVTWFPSFLGQTSSSLMLPPSMKGYSQQLCWLRTIGRPYQRYTAVQENAVKGYNPFPVKNFTTTPIIPNVMANFFAVKYVCLSDETKLLAFIVF